MCSSDLDANRLPWPRGRVPPARPALDQPAPYVAEVQALVKRRFADHPGDADDFWLPTTREEALRWLDDFVVHRLRDFGPYEDAISVASPTLFHSVLSPALNLGLVTPREVIDRAIRHASASSVPINSLEGFVRQVVGWREFVRGIEIGRAHV